MVNEFIKSLIPIIKNVIDAIDLRTTSGKKLEIEPPVKAPINLQIQEHKMILKKLPMVYLKCR